MNGFHGPSEGHEREDNEPREIAALRLHVEMAEEVIDGGRVFGGSIRDNLIRELPKAKEAGVDLGQLEFDALRLIDTLYEFTYANCERMAAKCRAEGKRGNAEEWHGEALKYLALHRREIKAGYEKDIAARRREGDEEGAQSLRDGLDQLIAKWNGENSATNF